MRAAENLNIVEHASMDGGDASDFVWSERSTYGDSKAEASLVQGIVINTMQVRVLRFIGVL